MRNFRPNLPLCAGLLLFAAANITKIYIDMPHLLLLPLMLIAFALEIWGIIIIARSPEVKNSKLRRWKLRLIGRDHGDQ